jgi:hypothetical protein
MQDTGLIPKPAGARWPVGFRFRGEDLNGLLITSVVAASLPAGMTCDGGHVDADGQGVWAWAEGGVAGTDYFVLFVWTRSDGMITPDIMRVCVR